MCFLDILNMILNILFWFCNVVVSKLKNNSLFTRKQHESSQNSTEPSDRTGEPSDGTGEPSTEAGKKELSAAPSPPNPTEEKACDSEDEPIERTSDAA